MNAVAQSKWNGIHLNKLRPIDKSLEIVRLICISDGVLQYSASVSMRWRDEWKGRKGSKVRDEHSRDWLYFRVTKIQALIECIWRSAVGAKGVLLYTIQIIWRLSAIHDFTCDIPAITWIKKTNLRN